MALTGVQTTDVVPGPSPAVPAWIGGERRVLAEAVVAGLVVGAVHLLFRLSSTFLVGALNDDGVYVTLGKAIAEGAGYRSIHLVGAPVQVKYPPGFPLLLAIPWTLAGSLSAVRATIAVLNLAATAAAAGLIWWVGRVRLRVAPWPLAVCAASTFLLEGTIQYFNIPLSEPYLVLGWAAALVIGYPLFDAGPLDARRVGRAVALGLVLAATTLFRSAGIALLPAVLLALALHRRWRETALCAAALLLPLIAWDTVHAAWIARGPVSSSPEELSYVRWLGVNGPMALLSYPAKTIAANGVEYVPKLASYLFSSQVVGVGIVGIAILAAGLACVRLWRSHTDLVLTVIAACALTLLWPFAQGRLLLPLLPFLGLLVATTVDAGVRHSPARVNWILPAVLGLAALAMASRQVQLRAAAERALRTGVLPPPQDLSPTLTLAVRSRFIDQVVRWVRANTTPDDRVMVDAPPAVYLYTGRRTVVAQPTESRLTPSVFSVPGRYLAERILADSVTLVVWAPPAPGLQSDILTIQDRCPGVLERKPSDFPAYFRVVRDERCLRERVLTATGSTERR
ncbi:MAG TPA: hypothetical protein VIW28_00455 [Gemmatimonadales bacterium]